MQHLVAFRNRPEGASDVISGRCVRQIVLEKCIKFSRPGLNRSQEIPSEAIRSGIFDIFRYNFRPEVDNDVVSGVAIDNVGMDFLVQFGGSRSNGSRDIRGADFVSNEQT